VREGSIAPEDLGLPRCDPAALRVAGVAEAAAAVRAVLAGEHGPRRDVALANAAAALYVGGRCDTLRAGVALAAQAIDSGRARRVLADLVAAGGA
jgi:anthranilate phosphoribosyltransferase